MPYQAGFQPQGVRRDRSDDFFEQRKRCSEARKLDEGRLERRLEKVRFSPLYLLDWPSLTLVLQLVALHFPSTGNKVTEATSKESTLTTITSLRDTLRSRSARELWRSVAGNVDVDIERGTSSLMTPNMTNS